jgi:hypothetical protein
MPSAASPPPRRNPRPSTRARHSRGQSASARQLSRSDQFWTRRPTNRGTAGCQLRTVGRTPGVGRRPCGAPSRSGHGPRSRRRTCGRRLRRAPGRGRQRVRDATGSCHASSRFEPGGRCGATPRRRHIGFGRSPLADRFVDRATSASPPAPSPTRGVVRHGPPISPQEIAACRADRAVDRDRTSRRTLIRRPSSHSEPRAHSVGPPARSIGTGAPANDDAAHDPLAHQPGSTAGGAPHHRETVPATNKGRRASRAPTTAPPPPSDSLSAYVSGVHGPGTGHDVPDERCPGTRALTCTASARAPRGARPAPAGIRIRLRAMTD